MKEKVIIIAEAGVNHNGCIEKARLLIEKAAEAKVDYIKFQTFIASDNISTKAIKAKYQIENTGKRDESQLEMVQKLELTPEMHDELFECCRRNNIKFLSTAFDTKSIKLINKYNLDIFKIPSGEITNLPYLESIANENYPQYYMSTGMCNLSDIEKAIFVLEENGISRTNIIVLHCNTEYPTPMDDVNLKAMRSIKKAFKVKVGYSDHTLGIEIPIAAVALGASVIEKHFTLDNTLPGPDHKASLEPDELNAMVSGIRNIEKALGDGIKRPSISETKNIKIARKSIIAKTHIKYREIFTEENITVKRPGDGISPMLWYEIIGKKASKVYQPDDLI